jgi:hypothetical protein
MCYWSEHCTMLRNGHRSTSHSGVLVALHLGLSFAELNRVQFETQRFRSGLRLLGGFWSNRGKSAGKRKLLIQWTKLRPRILGTARLCHYQSRLCRLGKKKLRSSSCFCFGVSRLPTSIVLTTDKRAHNLPRISKRYQSFGGARVFAPVTFWKRVLRSEWQPI